MCPERNNVLRNRITPSLASQPDGAGLPSMVIQPANDSPLQIEGSFSAWTDREKTFLPRQLAAKHPPKAARNPRRDVLRVRFTGIVTMC